MKEEEEGKTTRTARNSLKRDDYNPWKLTGLKRNVVNV